MRRSSAPSAISTCSRISIFAGSTFDGSTPWLGTSPRQLRGKEETMKADRIYKVLFLWCFMLLPIAAGAQTALSGSIAGVVKDGSGGILPGVTVEASSPSLIERTRTV